MGYLKLEEFSDFMFSGRCWFFFLQRV